MDTEAILQILPETLKRALEKSGKMLEEFEEIRLRAERPVLFRRGMQLFFLSVNGIIQAVSFPMKQQAICPSKEEMEQILLRASHFSVYAAEEQIRQGYLTIQGGHRIGICGVAIIREGCLLGIRKVSSYNIRIAREVIGCAAQVYPWLWDNDQLLDTLLVSPAGQGKTTLLRDLIRLISDGDLTHDSLTVGLADERGEVAACQNGVPQYDIGQNTDVMDGGSKTITMPMLLRTMAPQVLAADEAGGYGDIQIFKQAKKWGVALLTTAHGTIHRHVFDTDESRLQFDRYIEIQVDKKRQRSFHIYDQKRQLIQIISRGGSA